MKVSQGPIALRLATTACPPPPSAQTYWPLDACKATLEPGVGTGGMGCNPDTIDS